ncbi:AcrR family transcriptional regulator [Kutzneria viridogrisea]|nr:TetR/AcrR family transcriptional regulator [Kutzneria albida]MBA8925094.1 AcrR family transcriptional regulator [Kutzneria viridogrisea]
MGNRENLLAGARRCLFDKGYGRTTARDIAATAGVSLAAIGYHFGSKEALLNAALLEAVREWGDELAGTLTAVRVDDPALRFEAMWAAVLRSFEESPRLWAVQLELVAHLDQAPGLREAFTESTRAARLGLAELFGAPGDETVGGFYQALLGGLAMQYLTDPSSTLSGTGLLASLRVVAGQVR